MSAHCFKKVSPPKSKADVTVREMVKSYGDRWALLAPITRAGWAMKMSTAADDTSDWNDFLDMLQMERGQKSRCNCNEDTEL